MEARKLLGKDAENVSDFELQQDIETAELLKDIFFDQQTIKTIKPIQISPKVP